MADTAPMKRHAALLLVLCATLFAIPAPASADAGFHAPPRGAGTVPDYRPDAWIKLCGLSTGCTIDPLPHPWRGNNVYNTTGAKQSLSHLVDDGEDVWFWVVLQNDGAQADTFTLQGCKGKPRFIINTVMMGKQKRTAWAPLHITKEFKRGTAKFDFPGSATRKRVVFSVNIVTVTPGLTYRCPITITSGGPTPVKDTVVVTLTTY
jgi:hypothetical protein